MGPNAQKTLAPAEQVERERLEAAAEALDKQADAALDAETTSNNFIYLDAPYNGGSTLRMTVRKSPASGLNIFFTLSAGQLVCSSYRQCYATVRFDEGTARRFDLIEPSDHSNDVLFVSADHSFLASLKKAKKLVVELTVYEGGRPQFEFNVAGLEWDR